MDKTSIGSLASMHRWASLHSELFWVYDGPEQGCGQVIHADHRHGYWLWLIRKGNVTLQSGNAVLTAKQGQWMLSPHAETTQQFSRGAQILSIHFQSQWPTGENLFAGEQGMVWAASRTPSLEKTVSSVRQLARRHFPGARLDYFHRTAGHVLFMRMQSRFALFLAEFSQAMQELGRNFYYPDACDERLLQVLERLQEGPLRGSFPWDLAMKETCLSRRHIDRLLFEYSGMTAHSYWDTLKAGAAVRLLETTDFSIKETAYQLGFKQASHFTKWFQLKTGRSPKSHRQLGAKAKAEGLIAASLPQS